MTAKTRYRLHRLRLIIEAVLTLPMIAVAVVWRRTVLRKVTVIGVTGSVGKTTTTKLLGAILSRSGQTIVTQGAANGRRSIPQLLLRARPSHRFVVAEVGILKKRRMWRGAFVLNPDVSVITHVKWQHARNYNSVDEIAVEKSKLLDPLGSTGLAVLNADDARVAAMANGRSCRIRTFGIEKNADTRGADIRSVWPEPLSLMVADDGEPGQIHTQLHGEHWTYCVVAAIAAARALGASWEDCQAGIESVRPFPGRLSPIRLPNGADLLRDEYNGSLVALEQALEVLRRAVCNRRVLVVGYIRDMPQLGERGPEEVGRRCAEAADLMLFWGPDAERYREAGIAAGAARANVRVCGTQLEVADMLRELTGPGDLVIVKGFWNDHMTRVVWRQFGTVACELETCPKHHLCDQCAQLGFVPHPSVDSALLQQLLEDQRQEHVT